VFAIGLVTSMLGVVYWQENAGKIPSNADTAIKISTSAGKQHFTYPTRKMALFVDPIQELSSARSGLAFLPM